MARSRLLAQCTRAAVAVGLIALQLGCGSTPTANKPEAFEPTGTEASLSEVEAAFETAGAPLAKTFDYEGDEHTQASYLAPDPGDPYRPPSYVLVLRSAATATIYTRPEAFPVQPEERDSYVALSSNNVVVYRARDATPRARDAIDNALHRISQ